MKKTGLVRDKDFELLATGKTVERIIKYIQEYWYSKNITLHETAGKTLIANAKGIVPGYEVVSYRGGFAFIRML